MQTRATQPTDASVPFLPMTTHDIESLTNAILIASQSLSEITSRPDMHNNAATRELVQLLRCSALSIAPFINELVTIGKRQANSENVNLRAVYNLQEELEYLRDTFAYEALAKSIDISISVSDDVPVIFCDINSLRIHTLNNILSNALQHTPAGGQIAIRAKCKDSQTLEITISDTGAGLPASERERVFRKHLKLDPFRNSSSGMGLYNAQQCVQAHNGKISLVDEPDFSGATFKIEIPLHAGCIQPVTAKSSANEAVAF
ncbi:MAG: HAMP domain-containing histidine kinase [Nitrosomonadales bacterium]|nr:HAMP domain-containing histidine kinase [Nitrosomonadales bacterium]